MTLLLPPQIQQWEQNLEKFHMDLFRMRCYLASLQGGELPNPKSLLAAASRPSKLALGRLGILSVSSFHALVSDCAIGFGDVLSTADCLQSGGIFTQKRITQGLGLWTREGGRAHAGLH